MTFNFFWDYGLYNDQWDDLYEWDDLYRARYGPWDNLVLAPSTGFTGVTVQPSDNLSLRNTAAWFSAQSGQTGLPQGWTEGRYDAWKSANTTNFGIGDYTSAWWQGLAETMKPNLSVSAGVIFSGELAARIDLVDKTLTRQLNASPGGGIAAFAGFNTPLLRSRGSPSRSGFDAKFGLGPVIGLNGSFSDNRLLGIVPYVDSLNVSWGVGVALDFRLPDVGNLGTTLWEQTVPLP